KSFLNEWPLISDKLLSLLNDIKSGAIKRFGISEKQWTDWEAQLLQGSGGTLQNLGSSISSFFVNLVMLFIIPVFSFLILYYRQRLLLVFYGFFPPERKAKLAEVIRLSIHTYYNFIKGMILVYFLVGMLNSIGLLLLGVPHAILFGFLTAIMTFIPYVGIIIASLLPITYAWITYNSVWYPLGVIGIFAFVQYLEANVIFPWAVGHRLQLNTLLTLIVIVAGGILWGASGMILFVPFAAIGKLMADRMEGWGWLSILLGDEEPKKKSK
ncbi:MAG TPA: AI-2E family transporter, partial [Chitinophagaceae bacterium]|nr:AI-2E family transporter [Chitinophagaceae bacterium]